MMQFDIDVELFRLSFAMALEIKRLVHVQRLARRQGSTLMLAIISSWRQRRQILSISVDL